MLWYLELAVLACVATGVLSALRHEVWRPARAAPAPSASSAPSAPPHVWGALSGGAAGARMSSRRSVQLSAVTFTRMELAGGKSGPSGLRRSSERTELGERTTEKHSHASGLNGLRNIGNTCFMNSVIQCLSNTRPLLEYLADDKYTADVNTTLSCMKGALIKG